MHRYTDELAPRIRKVGAVLQLRMGIGFLMVIILWLLLQFSYVLIKDPRSLGLPEMSTISSYVQVVGSGPSAFPKTTCASARQLHELRKGVNPQAITDLNQGLIRLR